MGVKFGRIVIGFEEGDMEHGVKTGEIGGETEFVRKVAHRVVDREGTEAVVFKFIGWAHGLDMPAHKPDKLIWLVDGGGHDALVVVA